MANSKRRRMHQLAGLVLTMALLLAVAAPAMAANYQMDPDGLQRIGSLLDPDG